MKGDFPPDDCRAPFSLRGNPELFVEISNSKQKIQLLWPWLEAGNSQIHTAVLICLREASLGLPSYPWVISGHCAAILQPEASGPC